LSTNFDPERTSGFAITLLKAALKASVPGINLPVSAVALPAACACSGVAPAKVDWI